MPNRLARETSPYLLQHKDNPVDWYPWGEEALARARAEDKPILLSVGYFACHWCHVMEHESFENASIARLMNENFVCIKVDREEHPDLDQIYQNVAQAMTRSGGWPLTVFLTPELKPFFGGTYFPPDDRYGRPGFPRVLTALAAAYRGERAAVAENAERLTDFIRRAEDSRIGEGAPAPAREEGARRLFDDAATRLLDAVDGNDGGFDGAPKFPNIPAFTYLWRYGVAARSERAREAVLLMLDKMARGGIFDQLGGGFHRYSVDSHWAVPHFEKMLYDNGLALRLYSEALLGGEELGTRRELFVETIASTVAYLLSEMRGPDGLFYAAQDADSEGEEGKFCVWDPAELARELDPGEARAFALRYGVTDAGNFEHGKTVLFQARSFAETAAELGVGEPEARACLARGREKLGRARARRVRPGTDTKALASWNGLAISGLCWAAQALAREGLSDEAARARLAAQDAFQAARAKLGRGPGRLHATFQQDGASGVAKLPGRLEDYAFLAAAAIDVARFAAEEEKRGEFLQAAEEWVGTILQDFAASEGAGFFLTSNEQEVVIHRPRSFADHATPSGTAVALEAMAALAGLDWNAGAAKLESELARQSAALEPAAARNPYSCGQLLAFALERALGPVVVTGEGAREACRHAHVFAGVGGEKKGLVLCHRQACLPPVTSPEAAWREALERVRFSGAESL